MKQLEPVIEDNIETTDDNNDEGDDDNDHMAQTVDGDNNKMDLPSRTNKLHSDQVPGYKVTKNVSYLSRKSLQNVLFSVIYSKIFGVFVILFIGYLLIRFSSQHGPSKWSLPGCCHKWGDEEYIKQHLNEYFDAQKSGLNHQEILSDVFKVFFCKIFF